MRNRIGDERPFVQLTFHSDNFLCPKVDAILRFFSSTSSCDDKTSSTGQIICHNFLTLTINLFPHSSLVKDLLIFLLHVVHCSPEVLLMTTHENG
jgi:hypothetical protein